MEPKKVQNRIRKHIQNFARLLIAFWLPKCPPKPPKMEQTGVQNTYVFCVPVSNVISPFFERLFDGCSRRQALVSTAIYNTFVGCNIFCQVAKCIEKTPPNIKRNSFQNGPKSLPKSVQKGSPQMNRSLTKIAPKLVPKWNPKHVQKGSENMSKNKVGKTSKKHA